MKRILKATIDVASDQYVTFMSTSVKPISVQVQRGHVVLWAECEIPGPVKPSDVFVRSGTTTIGIMFVVTGQDFLSAGFDYLGTIQLHGGEQVLHCYVKVR